MAKPRSPKRVSARRSANRPASKPTNIGKPRAGLSAAQAAHELDQLNRIGIALSETRDVEQLLSLILQKARDITSADAGSLYLVERPAPSPCGEPPSGPVQLRFKLTHD